MSDPLTNLRFDILRNAIYHTARRNFFDRVNKYCNLFIIVLGTSAVGQFGPKVGVPDNVVVALVTVVATVQLVFDLAVRARDHEFLQKEYYSLLAKTEKDGHVEEKLGEWKAELMALYAEEPPPLRAMDAVAYNAACDSLGKDSARVSITWFQNLLRHVYPFNGTSFPYVGASHKIS